MAHALLCLRLSSVSAPRSSIKHLGVWLMAGLLGASCYTGPVNMRPTVTITEPADYFRGQSPVYDATAIDPEDGLLASVEWATTRKPCPLAAEVQRPTEWPTTGWTPGATFAVPADVTVAKFCVWARAKDRYGAFAIAAVPGRARNHEPTVTLSRIPASGSVPLNTPVNFTAELSDEDGSDSVGAVAWVVTPGASDAVAKCEGTEASDTKHCFVFLQPVTYKILVQATDGMDKAEDHIDLDVRPGSVPVARLEMKAPALADSYPIGTMFRLSGAKSSDADPNDILVPIWNEKDFKAEAPTSVAELVPCDGTFSPYERCFVADAPGTYRVALKVNDGTGDSPTEELRMVVRPDSPPCLKVTEPAMTDTTVPGHLDPNDPVKWFKVLRVEDDQDPYPPEPGGDALHNRTTFRWFVNSGSGYKPAWGDFASFPLPTDGYLYGQEVSVRLEIFDRVTSSSQLQTCTTDICKTSDACVQRMTWKVQFVL